MIMGRFISSPPLMIIIKLLTNNSTCAHCIITREFTSHVLINVYIFFHLILKSIKASRCKYFVIFTKNDVPYGNIEINGLVCAK